MINLRFLARLTVALCLVALPLAHAACSRAINVPVSATGQSVITDGDTIKGIYPDLLRSVGEKEACTFTLSAVPRARLEMLFETGRADILIPASKTPRRDMHGTFIPLVHNRAMLISIQSGRVPITSAQELLEQSTLKVALVRGFDYGSAYQELTAALEKQGRVILEVDGLSVARLLKAGTADVTIMAPSILAGALQADERVRDLVDRLRFEALREMPWGESGAYLSNRSLSPEDKAALRSALERAARSGVVWKGFQHYYAPAVLAGSIRPL
jgi:polar amino acid transport system substrate-binding protein